MSVFSSAGAFGAEPASPLGVFQDHADIGTVLHPGSAQYDATRGIYTLTGSGENVWATGDNFQFVWKQVSGDVALTADIAGFWKGAWADARRDMRGRYPRHNWPENPLQP